MRSNAEKVRALVAAMAVGLLAISSCGNSGREEALAQELKKPFGVGSAQKANAELEAAVKAKLKEEPRLREFNLSVSADVTRNQVTLSGAVPSEDLRVRAVELAKGAQAGVIVNNQIKVNAKGAGPARMAKTSDHA